MSFLRYLSYAAGLGTLVPDLVAHDEDDEMAINIMMKTTAMMMTMTMTTTTNALRDVIMALQPFVGP
jgi:hypothetical protein